MSPDIQEDEESSIVEITREGSFMANIKSAIYEARSKTGTMTLEDTYSREKVFKKR